MSRFAPNDEELGWICSDPDCLQYSNKRYVMLLNGKAVSFSLSISNSRKVFPTFHFKEMAF